MAPESGEDDEVSRGAADTIPVPGLAMMVEIGEEPLPRLVPAKVSGILLQTWNSVSRQISETELRTGRKDADSWKNWTCKATLKASKGQ